MRYLHKKIWYEDQEGVRAFFIKKLVESGRDFDVIDGNILCLDLVGVPALVAHMDTVNDRAMKNKMVYDKKTDRLTRKNAILGADDKAGVQIIHDLFDQCNFILTRDEEVGLLGARSLASMTYVADKLEEIEVPCLLEFDRMGNSDIVGPWNEYCCEELADDISAISGGAYNPEMGVCTDLDELKDLGVEGVNLSVGYYQQHTKNEYMVMAEFENACKLAELLLVELADRDYSFQTAPPKKDDYSWGHSGSFYSDKEIENCYYCGVELEGEEKDTGTCWGCETWHKDTIKEAKTINVKAVK